VTADDQALSDTEGGGAEVENEAGASKAASKTMMTTTTTKRWRERVAPECRHIPLGDSAYKSIVRNIYLERPERTASREETPICGCTYVAGKAPHEYCGADCINRLTFVECNPRYCPLGRTCSNQRFQRREYAPLERFLAGAKGWGVRAVEDVPAGTFLIEYVGEVISNQECMRRLQERPTRHYYYLTLDASECIDATERGNLARFINHSCNPNAETQKWWVGGEIRVGIFALRDISAGEEITFDYQFERLGQKKQPCLCGEPNCRGYLGAKKRPEPASSSSSSSSSSARRSGGNGGGRREGGAARRSRSDSQRTQAERQLDQLAAQLARPLPRCPAFLRRNLRVGMRRIADLLARHPLHLDPPRLPSHSSALFASSGSFGPAQQAIFLATPDLPLETIIRRNLRAALQQQSAVPAPAAPALPSPPEPSREEEPPQAENMEIDQSSQQPPQSPLQPSPQPEVKQPESDSSVRTEGNPSPSPMELEPATPTQHLTADH
jgi:histone-lysine N-methyltransferase SETD2